VVRGRQCCRYIGNGKKEVSRREQRARTCITSCDSAADVDEDGHQSRTLVTADAQVGGRHVASAAAVARGGHVAAQRRQVRAVLGRRRRQTPVVTTDRRQADHTQRPTAIARQPRQPACTCPASA